jgi:hypothetical protein
MERVSARPTGTRLVVVVVGLIVLAVLAVIAVVAGGDDGDNEPSAAATSTTSAGGALTDEDLAVRLLPPIGALGSEWVDAGRDDHATEVTEVPDDPCAVGPVPAGVLARDEQRRVIGGAVSDTLSVTVGVLADGAVPADLASEEVRTCLLTGLQGAVEEGATVALVEDGPALVVAPGGEVAVARFAVTKADGTPGGTFDFVLVHRGRGVSLGLIGGLAGNPAISLQDVATALDQPLLAAGEQLQ